MINKQCTYSNLLNINYKPRKNATFIKYKYQLGCLQTLLCIFKQKRFVQITRNFTE